MPTLQPTTILSKPLVLAAYLVAASAKFQELCACANAEEARQRVYYDEASDKDDAPRPRAIACWAEDYSITRQARNSWDHTGTIVLSIELRPDQTYLGSLPDEQIDMCNKFGLILEQMRDVAGQGTSITDHTHLNVNQFSVLAGPSAVDKTEEDEYFYGLVLGLRWAN